MKIKIMKNKPKIYVELNKEIPFDGGSLLVTMSKMINNQTWKWECQPKKESWWNKFSKVKKLFLIVLP